MDVAVSCCVVVVPTRAKQKAGTHGVNFGKHEVCYGPRLVTIRDLTVRNKGKSVHHNSSAGRVYRLKAKAAGSDKNPKTKSVICTNCDGNGAVLCSQCKGSGVNAVDIFDGQFKAGDSCWLCGGKKDMLCGDCNGAGFIGGFMSTFDE